VDLSNLVGVVTGGAQGIGEAIAVGLAEVGAEVVVADIQGQRAGEAAEVLRAKGMAARGAALDVTRPEQWAELAASLPDGVDFLVNNAGLYGPVTRAPFEQQTDDEWHRVMDVNVFSIFIGCKAMVPLMRRRGGGSIVNISSTGIFKTPALLLPYIVSKGAVNTMTHVLSRELGADNIRVNNVAPGFTLSEGVMNRETPVEPQRLMNLEGRSLKRDMVPDDIAGAVRFLCSPDSAFITGQTLVVDGGFVTH
jgi:NAD(P)-dependent dehydrogenase (short-subunit alcohol dehydrogenase family)